jgi:hypothetical protein
MLCTGSRSERAVQRLLAGDARAAPPPPAAQPGSARVSDATRAAARQRLLDALAQSPAAAAGLPGKGHALLEAAAQVTLPAMTLGLCCTAITFSLCNVYYTLFIP